MTKVKPKLYLNMSPETVEEGGLIFARNMKIDDDGHLTSDYGYKNISTLVESVDLLAGRTIVGHIVGLDNKIYLFTEKPLSPGFEYRIFEYDEVSRTIVNTGVTQWTWGGGHIYGCVSTNVSGEKILTIGEEKHANAVTPLKHINLSNDYYDVADESLYTQAPVCPTANLALNSTYIETIPSGVYVFFIRYKIRKDVYTNWFLCSRPVFAGTSETITTIQGGLKYINTHKDSAKSFIFDLSFVNNAAISWYKEFQLGFIITHDDATDARIWKHFKMPSNGTLTIYFNYDNVKETNIDDLLANTYELYNVGNVTNFKNKLYISNYKESNFNPDLLSTSGVNLNNAFSLSAKAIDNYDAKGYADVKLYYNNDFKELDNYITFNKYDYYTKIKLSNSTKNIDSLTSTEIRNLLTIDISEFYKDTSSEFEDAFVFDLEGHVDQNPDIIYIAGFTNSVHNKSILGTDFTLKYNSSGNGWNDIGLSLSSTEYSDVYKVNTYIPAHPFNGKLTYGYGIFGETQIPAPYIKYATWNTIPINAETIINNNALAANGFLTDAIRNTISRELKKEITKLNRFILGYATITSGANTYNVTVITNKATFDKDNYVGSTYETNYGIENKNNSSNYNIQDSLKSEVSAFVSNHIVGIDDNGSIVLAIDGNYIKSSAIEFSFKACEFELDNGDNVAENNDENYNVKFSATLKSTVYKCICTFGIADNKIDVSPKQNLEPSYRQTSTMVPLSTYKAYVHFVDEHNIITNGYPLANTIQTSGASYDLTKFILNYSVNVSYLGNIINTYRSFFISLKNVGDIIVETFGNTYSNGYNIVQCLEADALLYNINDKIILINNSGSTVVDINDNAKYYSSGESIPSIAFGNCGFIAWKSSEPVTEKLYVKISRSNDNNEEHEKGLIKATPYLPLQSQTNIDVSDGFYGGYFCSIKKPSFPLSSSCYVSGNDVYSATRGTIIKLNDFEGFINTQDSNIYFLRSNYNLNYLSLVEDISDHIHKTGTTSISSKQVIKVINSAILSSIYDLKGMYRNFMNKTFTAYDKDYIVQFDNTIRVSNVLSDETFNNAVFKFKPENYYNVPTDRGIIVSLFSIGNNIFVHTKGSLYKFDANQTIIASDTDIKLQESEPFSAGITQIIDSQYGYGGIENKEAGCVTFDSYFFYDKYSTHIFAYGGNSQVQLIDASIYKLLKYYSPEECITLHDDINHRVLFMFSDCTNMEVVFTISYNYKSKTFVSIHDINLAYSFAGRTRCFSYEGKRTSTIGHFCELFNKDTDLNTTEIILEDLHIRNIYGDATWFNNILTHSIQSSMFNIAVVMFPSNSLREVINFIKYIGEIIEDYITEEQDYDLIRIPKHNTINPVKSLQIVTDTCLSNIISSTVDDTVRPDHTLTDHKGFKHEIDSWNTNYFRNTLDINNVYNYPGETDTNGPGQPRVNYRKTDNTITTAHPNSDNHSLVYGKYYVLLFNFKDTIPIKFEEVFINSEKY